MFGARAIKRRRAKEEELKVHLAGEQSFCRGQHFKLIFIFSIKALRANGPPPVFERSGPSAVKLGNKDRNDHLFLNILLKRWGEKEWKIKERTQEGKEGRI